MAHIYTNQALTLDVTFTDEDSTAIDISSATITAELYAPTNRTTVSDDTLSGSVVSGGDGTAQIVIPVDTLDDAGQWRIQAIATISGTPWPAVVSAITVYDRGHYK